MSDTTPRRLMSPGCLACLWPIPLLRLPSPPLPHGKYTEVQNDISSPPAPSPCASFSHPSSRLRKGTSARWAVLHRKRWPLADTWRWPLSPAQGPLHLNFSFKKGKGKSHLTYCRNAFNGTFEFPNVWGNTYTPFHEEHEFSCGICGTDNSFWIQTSSKAP